MKRQARLKSTGEIIEVRISMDYRGHATWVNDVTKAEYYSEELEWLDNIQTPNSNSQIEDLIAFDPEQMEYDPQTMTARFFQNCHIKMTEEIIQASLKFASDKQLQDELKRRADKRRALKGQILRCRDCIHCIQGYTSKFAASRGYKTSVCELKPKDKAARYCFYSTLQSRKACEKFELKNMRHEQTDNNHH